MTSLHNVKQKAVHINEYMIMILAFSIQPVKKFATYCNLWLLGAYFLPGTWYHLLSTCALHDGGERVSENYGNKVNQNQRRAKQVFPTSR